MAETKKTKRGAWAYFADAATEAADVLSVAAAVGMGMLVDTVGLRKPRSAHYLFQAASQANTATRQGPK
ncbi:MAG: hypothetical protein SFW62_07645 [Alphaproteobacteria bacterium]|nr:hypothetical protein [Alphaproteobacteria bacterium]